MNDTSEFPGGARPPEERITVSQQTETIAGRYNRNPRYPTVGGRVERGWLAVTAALPPEGGVLAIDGPAALPWADLPPR